MDSTDSCTMPSSADTRSWPDSLCKFRFHLERDADLVKYVITKKRLLAGLGSAGDRQLQFVIAEEGITAAAYVVISIVDRAWTIEECGDRDPSVARVGAAHCAELHVRTDVSIAGYQRAKVQSNDTTTMQGG